jgi:hypothetical protein
MREVSFKKLPVAKSVNDRREERQSTILLKYDWKYLEPGAVPIKYKNNSSLRF